MEYGLVVLWLCAFAALAALGLPVAARLFPRSATGGAGFALPLSLVVVGVVAFWVGRVAFGVPALLAGLVVLVALSALAAFDRGALRDGRVELDPRTRAAVDRPAVVDTAAVFVVAFLFLVAVRAADPAVHAAGGEKFLDFGLLESLLRAGALPPEDVWFAGEPVRYYYGGHLLSALLALLTATPARFAYNLALAGFYATLVTAVFDLSGAVAASRGVSRRAAGLLGAFVVGVASNLATPGRLLARALPADLRTLALDAAGVDAAEVEGAFSYWTASRVIPGTINEFPLFAWLNGDLHAHMLDTPFLLLAAAVAFALFRAGSADDSGSGTEAGPALGSDERRRRRLLLFGLLPAVGGLQAVINTWSAPAVFGVVWVGLTLARTPPWALLPGGLRGRVERAVDGRRVRAELARPAVALGLVALPAALALVVGAPFLLGAVAGGGSSRAPALVTADMRSSLGGLLVVHGAFAAAFGAYLFARLRIDAAGAGGGVRRDGQRGTGWLEAAVAVGSVAAVAAAGLVVGLPVVGLAAPLLVAGWVAARSGRAGFEAALVVAGTGLVLLVEVVYLNEQAGPGRMNTVFKTYAQVWPLWSVAAGVALAAFPRAVRPTLWPSPDARRAAGATFVALLVVSTGLYGGLALSNHFADDYPDEPTLDATDFVAEYHAAEERPIDYLGDLEGQPTLLSAPATGTYPGAENRYGHEPGMYSWQSSPAASLTGIPTVAGWEHEVGYRGSAAYFERVRDVDAAYTDANATAAVLREYDVRYVWVGPAERARYGAENVRPFDALAGVDPVVETPAVTLYEVDASDLPEGESENGS
ncbi:DUF2298 domain-containing protein [Candidatus Halobonum tyrrellensis]|uniref:Chlor_Arch_YYY domain-containing protein n=1 Tax=Candidatus Halobonum tyrrellensis G22 TaxID=1324957 RepID=V4J3G2_9EURY|nr:DUF2298 domain-containing protein [Candidatus Halobonum tyrrellensis]ESP89922.1 hypothetical protein K933_01832 [Candidatus Halobonum tyrrellensis G22]